MNTAAELKNASDHFGDVAQSKCLSPGRHFYFLV